MLRRFLVVLAAAAAGFLLSACAGSDDLEGQNTPLRMADNSFSPAVVRIPAGGTIRVTNDGKNPHNAIAVDGTWSTEGTFGELAMLGGDSTRVSVDEPGVYRFYCSFHGSPDGLTGMVGVLAVGDVPEDEIAAVLEEGEQAEPTRDPTGTVLRVPEDHTTIQEAVDAAAPGDLVLVGPGVYHEEVVVRTPSLTIRGADRNAVILDGEFSLTNGISAYADGVAIENMSARNYQLNGFYWSGVEGYRGSYLTAYNNADYGVYAFDAVDGVLDHSYASGSPDAGFYIGQCRPCRAVVNDVIAESNGVGYSGTNASDVWIVSSVWRGNHAGIVPNTLDGELLPPEADNVIVANLVIDNDNGDAPAKPLQDAGFGNGVVLLGGVGNLIAHNIILDHQQHGILLVPNPDEHFWFSGRNEVRDNAVGGSGRGDIGFAGPAGGGDCFSGNRLDRTVPPGLQSLHACDGGIRLPLGADLSTTMVMIGNYARASNSEMTVRVEDQPAPPPQPQMPDAGSAPASPAHDVFDNYDEVDLDDLASVPLPDEAEGLAATSSPEVTVSGIPLSQPGAWQLLFSFYGYLLPLALLAAWMALAFWDLARRDDLGRGAVGGWIAVVLLVPFLGVIAYHALAARLDGWFRAAIVGGGLFAYLAILAIGAALGGLV